MAPLKIERDGGNIQSITTLDPNVEDPTFGMFVDNRLRQLAERPGDATASIPTASPQQCLAVR